MPFVGIYISKYLDLFSHNQKRAQVILVRKISENIGKMLAFVAILCIAVAEAHIMEDIHHPQPYKFGYSIKDHHGAQHREEASNGAGGVVGNYGFTDDRGIARQVNYVADHAGFRAQVKTNEPGTSNQSPAAVHMISNDPYAQGAAVPYVSRPGSPVVPALALADPVLGFPTMHGYGGHGLAHGAAYDLGHGNVYGLGHGAVYGLEHGVAPGLGHQAVYGLGHETAYGLGHGNVYGLGHGAHGLGYGGHGHGGALAYSGLLGGGYGGVVNYGAPLVGGAIRGFDSRFVNLA